MLVQALLAAKGDVIVTIDADASVESLVHMLFEHRIGAVVVSADGRRIDGIVSERDIVRAIHLGSDMLASPVSSIMTTDVFNVTADIKVDELAALMTDKRIRHVPVVDEDGAMVGIVSIGDVVKSRIGELEVDNTALVNYVTSGR